ncbi:MULTISPECIES: DUF7331 family protein [Haloferax]|uniref:Uncharacterized protein n=1 Tax=Haloferax mediterranei (strain ATCC 33500 / DSM 1411 / JCM 8866 / NBRC 14739 / NCIMB 2177 / R-4) TaxID=523841 RepID=I3RA90_HALMT|nr:hypothetical protein [Haloferax mediterranei]AFK21150.1 hypothetical protein HFX_6022 [Haloferax mediterranei ATCC 33500]ELZ97061.1 hypothetical protein C439_17103 [Haloferax mediterranei ATCC 33500]MDX5990193.1 hypothetical protein [Haloferax mediterranei ATCC 33500]
MRTESHEVIDELTESKGTDLDDFTGYEDGESYVVCDKTNANAWIRSDVTTQLPP